MPITPRYDPAQGVPPWLRQPGETLREFEALGIYFTLGGSLRTLAQAARVGRVSLKTLKQVSVRWQWVARAKEFDAEMDRRVRERPSGEAIEMRDRQLALARGLQAAASTELRAWINVSRAADQAQARREAEAARVGAEPPAPRDPVIKPRDVLRMAHTGVVLERLILGEATARVEERRVIDTSSLTPDELRTLDTLLAKLGAPELDDQVVRLGPEQLDETSH